MSDEKIMKLAIAEAAAATQIAEVPIGAVAVMDGKVIARAHNVRETAKDPLGHAELLLIRKIVDQKILPSFRFDNITIYVTCEPCIMCMGAMLQARVKRLVFGCPDPKAGACGSLFNLSNDARLNHKIEITHGILSKECADLSSRFFKDLRQPS